jgi:hypothetical protein
MGLPRLDFKLLFHNTRIDICIILYTNSTASKDEDVLYWSYKLEVIEINIFNSKLKSSSPNLQ